MNPEKIYIANGIYLSYNFYTKWYIYQLKTAPEAPKTLNRSYTIWYNYSLDYIPNLVFSRENRTPKGFAAAKTARVSRLRGIHEFVADRE